MNREKSKMNAIINEITTFLLNQNAKNICLKINDTNEEIKVNIVCDELKLTEDIIDDLRNILNVKKEIEVEETYWQLIGNNDDRNDLYLVGKMIDNAELYLENGDKFKMIISRKK